MKKTIMLNSFWSVMCRVILVVFAFVERKVFLQTLGVGVLGIGGSLSSLVAVVSLADMGFGSAIIYHLYEPLERDNYDEVNRLLSVYRGLYSIIAMIVIAFAMIMSPFLQYYLKGITLSAEIYVFWMLIAINTAMTYILSYKRCLFMADKKDYICKLVDLICSLTFFAIEIILLLVTRSYILFLFANLCKTVVSNLIVHILCNKHYVKYKRVRFAKMTFRKLLPDFRNLWGGQLAAYIFNSTDNLVISAFVGTVSVGFLSGYGVVIDNFKTLFYAIFVSLPIYLGRMLAADENSIEKVTKGTQMYSFATFVFSLLVITPEAVLLQRFVETVWGKNTSLSNVIVVLLLIEQYFSLQHEPNGCVLIATGDFVRSKRADILAAISNILISLLLVRRFGIAGVIVGTIVGDLGKCIAKSYYALRGNLQMRRKEYYWYVTKECAKIIIVVLSCISAIRICSLIKISNFIYEFLVRGVVAEIVAITFLIVICYKTKEFIQFVNYIMRREEY